jgi:hypothetical protein
MSPESVSASVGDATVLLLHHGISQDLTPGQVMRGNLAKLALVDLGWMLASGRWDLVADRQESVEAVVGTVASMTSRSFDALHRPRRGASTALGAPPHRLP